MIIDIYSFLTSQGIYSAKFDTLALTGFVEFSPFNGGVQQSYVSDAERGQTSDEEITDYCIANKLYEFFGQGDTPFFYFTATPGGCTTPPDPPPGTICDLTITNISTTDETVTGANDGTVIISATTSNPNIQYTLDNINFQLSGNFSGLSPGTYLVSLVDANSCNQSANFTINPAVIENTTFTEGLPVIDLGGGKIARWSAAFNPIVLQLQRKDFDVVSVDAGSNGSQYRVTLDVMLSSKNNALAITQPIYIKTAKYEYYGKVTSEIVSGKTVLIVPTVYVGDDAGGFIIIPNSKPGYYIELELIYGYDPNIKNSIFAEFTPGRDGKTKADLSGFLRSLVKPVDEFQYNVVNWRDINLAASYNIRYREVWETGDSAYYTSEYPLYVTYSARQLGEAYGGNMAQYTPFLSGQAKWLTEFKRPKYTQGLPFDLAFILSEYIVSQELFFEITPNNGTIINGMLLNADGSYLLNADLSRFLIERNDNPAINNVQVQEIIEQLGVNRLLINQNFDTATEIKVNIYYLNNGDKVYVMEDLYLDIITPCEEPYIYLKFINHLGGWDYYRFGYNQVIGGNVSIDEQVVRYVSDWAYQDTINDVISKSANDKITFGADGVSQDDMRSLAWLKKSVKVQMYIGDNNWQTVVIDGGGLWDYDTRKKAGTVEFVAQLRDDNIQTQ